MKRGRLFAGLPMIGTGGYLVLKIIEDIFLTITNPGNPPVWYIRNGYDILSIVWWPFGLLAGGLLLVFGKTRKNNKNKTQ